MVETSITIDDVGFVVDCGKAKETSYAALNNTRCLLPSWISKAAAQLNKEKLVALKTMEDGQVMLYSMIQILLCKCTVAQDPCNLGAVLSLKEGDHPLQFTGSFEVEVEIDFWFFTCHATALNHQTIKMLSKLANDRSWLVMLLESHRRSQLQLLPATVLLFRTIQSSIKAKGLVISWQLDGMSTYILLLRIVHSRFSRVLGSMETFY